MGQSVESREPRDRPEFATAGMASLLSISVRTIGVASLCAALLGAVRILLLFLGIDAFPLGNSPEGLFFYFPAGAILLLAARRSRLPAWLWGGALGFAVYVSVHLLADLGAAVGKLGFLGLPFYMASTFGEKAWHPIGEFLIRGFGNFLSVIEVVWVHWFSALPFVALGMIFASVSRHRPLLLLTLFLSLLLGCFCLLQFAGEILWGLMN